MSDDDGVLEDDEVFDGVWVSDDDGVFDDDGASTAVIVVVGLAVSTGALAT